jgi:hypothetical protein
MIGSGSGAPSASLAPAPKSRFMIGSCCLSPMRESSATSTVAQPLLGTLAPKAKVPFMLPKSLQVTVSVLLAEEDLLLFFPLLAAHATSIVACFLERSGPPFGIL